LQNLLNHFNHFFESAPDRLLKRRTLVITLFVFLSGVFIYGMISKFSMDMSLESWFQDDDPTKVSLDQFRQQFGSDDGIYIVYEAKNGDVFSETALLAIKRLHTELDEIRLGLRRAASDVISPDDINHSSMLKRIVQIDSLYNARYQIAEGDTLISQKLLSSDFPESQAAREEKRKLATLQESFQLSLYSKNYQYAGIRLKTDFGVRPLDNPSYKNIEVDLLAQDDFDFSDADDDLMTGNLEGLSVDTSLDQELVEYQEMQMDEYLTFMNELRTLVAKPEYKDFKFHFTGNAAMMEFAMNNMKQASGLMGLMLLAVVVLLWLLFRSFSAVFWPVVVIACSAFWSIGLLSLLGVTLSTMVSLSFMLILAVGTADCVHVLSAYIFYRQEDYDHRIAMKKAYRKTGIPIFLTTITTMAGMSALMISDIPQIAVFGLNSALGVGVAFIFTLFLLPVLLDIWHPYHKKAEKRIEQKRLKGRHRVTLLQSILDKIPELVSRRKLIIIFIYFSTFGLFVFGTSLVKIDSNLIELAKDGSPIRVTYEVVDKHMMGAQNLEFMLSFAKPDALKDPSILKTIDTFQRYLIKEYPEYVVKTFSLADFVKDTNQVMHEGNIEFKRIPDDPNLSAQLLYLFDNANSRDRRNIVSDDYSKTHISVMLKNKGSYEYTHFFEAVQNDLNRHFEPLRTTYPDMEVNVTGALSLMMELIDHISWTQIKSFAFALLIITLLMMFSLGSVQAGLISMVPNLLPAFFTFGVMGLLGIPLDTDTLIIAPLIIGIAVDDTIHFIAHYRDAWFQTGDVQKALSSTIKEVGQAVTFTTLVLGIGFSMLAFSDYMGLAKTGIFGSLSIVIALTSDLFLLPALISWLKPDLGRKRYLAKQNAQEEGLVS